MTRIFEALRKAQRGAPAPASGPATVPSRPAVVPTPAAATLAPTRVRGAEAVAATVPVLNVLPRVEVVGVGELPKGVAREMTTLRIGLEAALEGRAQRVVMFESSQAREGTSTVSGQFAQLLAADARLRVVLVDGHARRPVVGARFTPGGLAASRARAGNGSDPVQLSVLPLAPELQEGGVLPPQTMRAVLAGLSGPFDWVVVDGPPVLESPEAVELAALTDGVVIVVQAGSTKRPVVARAVELLRKGGATVLGSVLNRRRLEIPEFIYRRI